MKFSESIIHILQESGKVNSESVIDSSFVNSLEKASILLVDTFKNNGKVLFPERVVNSIYFDNKNISYAESYKFNFFLS